MTYRMIEDYTCSFTGGPLKAKGWAIHWWGDPNQRPTFDGILRVLLNRADLRQASVNFMAEAGKVACLVDPFTVAWGQGDGATGWGNNNLVSVECNPRCTAEDRETVAELIADQHIKNDIPIVLYPHNKFTATQCPGAWEQWIPWLTERAKQIVKEKTLANTGDTMASFHPSEDYFNAMIAAQARIDKAMLRSLYVRGDKSSTIYDITGGVPRALTLVEWEVLSAAGFTYAPVEQAKLDAFVKHYNERNPA